MTLAFPECRRAETAGSEAERRDSLGLEAEVVLPPPQEDRRNQDDGHDEERCARTVGPDRGPEPVHPHGRAHDPARLLRRPERLPTAERDAVPG